MDAAAAELTIRVSDRDCVSALLQCPERARACYVFAHGAGAGMNHSFMNAAASGLVDRGIATLRYQFPFMQRGSKRTDAPAVAHTAVRAAVEQAAMLLPDASLFAGGKSFGGRMTSQAQAEFALPRVQGIVFFGFPLHPPGKPSVERAEHLSQVQIPMLFLQGERDELANVALLRTVTDQLGERATLQLFDDADHSFHVRARSGRSDAQVLDSMLDVMANWITAHASRV